MVFFKDHQKEKYKEIVSTSWLDYVEEKLLMPKKRKADILKIDIQKAELDKYEVERVYGPYSKFDFYLIFFL